MMRPKNLSRKSEIDLQIDRSLWEAAMKRLLLFITIFALTIPALAQFSTVSCTHGETGTCRQATTCSQANVQAAITASSAGTSGYVSPTSLHGDGVYIPAGSCSWGSPVSWLDKNIGVIGGVGGTTTITASGDAFDVSVTGAVGNGTTTSAAFRISNLTISGGHPLNINTSNPNMTTFAGYFRFDNIIYNTSAGGNAVIIFGPVYGVFDHLNGTVNGGNHFEEAMFLNSEFPPSSAHLMGETVGRTFAIGLGDQNAVYIENSTFNCAGAFGSGAISDSESGPQRMVFRDNTVTGSCYHYAHWTRNGEWDGGRIELYNNNYTCGGSGCSGGYPGRFDAGTGVIFNNTVTGYGTTSFQIDEARGCGAQTGGNAGECAGSPPTNSQIDVNAGDTNAPGWPCAGQVGTACIAGGCSRSGMTSVPFIMWNNGTQTGCSTGGSCTNSYSFNIDGPPGGGSCTRSVTNYLKSTAHSLAGGLNGAIDFFSGASKPSLVGIYNGIASYTPFTFPYPTTTSVSTVATPTASPVAGTYTGSQTITLSTTPGGATICFTTDGSTPTANGAGTCTHGTTYSTGFAVTTGTTVVKAIGSLAGDIDSGVFSGTYVIIAKIITKMVITPPSTGFWIFSPTNTGSIQLGLFCKYNDGTTDTTCTGNGGTVTWFAEYPTSMDVNSSGLATGQGTNTPTPTAPVKDGIGAYNGTVFAHTSINVNQYALTCLNIRPETTGSNIVQGSRILLSAEDCSPASGSGNPNVDGPAIGNFPAWTSSNTGVATVDTEGLVTGVSVGTAVITATLPSITQTRTVTVTNPTFSNNTWFVRSDGGTVKDVNVPGGQCDGTLDVAQAGSSGGHCAVKEIMYCFTDETSSSVYTGIAKGGDLCSVRPPTAGTFYHLAQKAPGTAWVTAAQAPGAIAPPSGPVTSTTATAAVTPGTTVAVVSCSGFTGGNQVLIPEAGVGGSNYVGVISSCSGTTLSVFPATSTLVASGTPVRAPHPTRLVGTTASTCESADPLHIGTCIATVSYGAVAIEMYDSQNFDVKGIDFWSGVDCNSSLASNNLDFNCPSGAGQRMAILADQFTSNFTIENSRIHGYIASIEGTPGPGTVWTNVSLLYNAQSGISFDNPFGFNGDRTYGFSFINGYIGFAGFTEELPKPLAGGSVVRDGSGNLNVTFPSGSLVNYLAGTNFTLTGATPSDLNGTYPVTSINFNQNTTPLIGGAFRGCNDGYNTVGCADFATPSTPTFVLGDYVNITGVPSAFPNGPYEVLSINTSPVGFTVAGSIYTRPGWSISGSIPSGGSASSALSIVAAAAGSSETASVLGIAGHVTPAHRGMDQADTGFSNGDCIGTGNNTIGSWISIGSQFHRCSQDGWDMLHSTILVMLFLNNFTEGNEGQPAKGGLADYAVFSNNFIVANAGANMSADPNVPPEYNQYLTTFYRAGDGFLTANEAWATMIIANNTFMNSQNVGWDDFYDSELRPLPFTNFINQNNLIVGYTDNNNPVWNASLPTIYYSASSAFTPVAWSNNNNLAWNSRNPPSGGTGNNWTLGSCPNIACVPITTNPNILNLAGEIAAVLPNWNLNILPGSAPTGAGINNIYTPATDYNGVTTTVPSVVGAVNPAGTPTVATPTFSPVAGSYGPAQSVTISTSTGGASIVYTNDGSTPTVTALTCTITHGTLYTGAVTVSTSQTLNAIGCESSFNASSVGTAAYVINGAVANPTCTPAAGTYGSTQSVTCSSATGGSTTVCTIDGSTPNHGSPACTSISVAVSLMLKALSFEAGWSDSSVVSNMYVISGTVATPTAAPPAGTYGTTQSVALSDVTAGAAICFTNDGTTPTAPSAGTCSGGTTQTYTSAITVSTTTTIKAIGTKAANTNSSMATFLYTITPMVNPGSGAGGNIGVGGNIHIP